MCLPPASPGLSSCRVEAADRMKFYKLGHPYFAARAIWRSPAACATALLSFAPMSRSPADEYATLNVLCYVATS
jgi:hypothetical protein